MHLSYKTSKYKGKIYKSYSIAESYREGNTVKKRIIWSLGKLTNLQALQIRKICQVMSDPEKVLTSIEDIVVQKSKPYGDLAIASALWDEWRLSKAFTSNPTASELSPATVAKILTINKCVAPCYHYSTPQKRICWDRDLNNMMIRFGTEIWVKSMIGAMYSVLTRCCFRKNAKTDNKKSLVLKTFSDKKIMN